MNRFGKFLKNERSNSGYPKTTDLAKVSGIPQSTISRLEAGEQSPKPPTLRRLSLVLNASYFDLLKAAGYVDKGTMGEFLTTLRIKAGYDIQRFSKLTMINKEELILIENNKLEVGKKHLEAIASALQMDINDLIVAQGEFASMFLYGNPFTSGKPEVVTESNISSYTLSGENCSIPVLGSIPAGMAVETIEDVLEWIDIPEEWTHGGRQYFGLVVHGDSMFPEYLENDIVIIRKQPSCDSGDDCAVMVNATDATLKRVRKFDDAIELEPLNPMYGKRKFTREEVISLPVTILGVVVELRRKKK